MGARYLRELCHARAGDKGNISNIGLVLYNKADYDLVERTVTCTRVKKHFGELVSGEVVRYGLPNLGAFNFVLHDALDGGTTRSLRIDTFGKSLSAHLLSMPLD